MYGWGKATVYQLKSFREKVPITRSRDTYSSQSTAMIRLMSLVGSPTAVNTSSMVTNPALGTLAAPILASVAVKLRVKQGKTRGKYNV